MSNIKSLSKLQELIQSTVRCKLISNDLNHHIVEKPPISIQERINIYQEAYQVRLLESLRDDFSRVEEALGDHEFENVATIFIDKYPSKVQNLAEYSKNFPDFIKIYKPYVYLEAITDWLEILSINAEIPLNQISQEDVQAGHPFKIKSIPSTLTEQVDDKHIVVFRYNDETKLLNLSQVLFNFLKFLETERSLEEVSQYAQENKITDKVLSELMTEWIQNKIIYCIAIK